MPLETERILQGSLALFVFVNMQNDTGLQKTEQIISPNLIQRVNSVVYININNYNSCYSFICLADTFKICIILTTYINEILSSVCFINLHLTIIGS